MISIEEKYQVINMSDALHRNLNDNFISVSLEVLDNGDVQSKFILTVFTEQEEEYIDDAICELSAMQDRNCILKAIVEVGDGIPLRHIVYQRSSSY